MRMIVAAACALWSAVASGATLQSRLDAALPGATIRIGKGTYHGDLVIRKPVHLIGEGRPLLIGSGAGTVVQIVAGGATIDGFDIDGLGGGDLGKDASGIHVAASNATVSNCRIRNTLFGIYLRQANGSTVDHCLIRGIPGKAPGEKGSGIHVWNTDRFSLRDNEIVDVRDGFYIQSSSHGEIVRNRARDLRYGLHYMFSDDNVFDDNTFENGAAGTAVMYSRRIIFRRNRFLHNRGFASVGLLFKTCDDVIAEDNLIADNARGIFIEGSTRNVFRRNIIAQSDTALVVYDSCSLNRFEGNSFIGNQTPLTFVGRHTDTKFEGNYWSDNNEPDLDNDGRSDRPYRLSSVFDHLRANLTAADLLTLGAGAKAMAIAEETFPVLDPFPVVDPRPLVRPPALMNVPTSTRQTRRRSAGGLSASLAGIAFGLTILFSGSSIAGRGHG